MELKNKQDIEILFKELKVSPQLKKHLEMVNEVALQLCKLYENHEIKFNKNIIDMGSWIHDIGKSIHVSELTQSGNCHEEEGQRILLERGVDNSIANCCVSHGNTKKSIHLFEESTVALADKLWKGVRNPELEVYIIDYIAHQKVTSRWDVFVEIDSVFEEIASHGYERLMESQNY